MKKKIVFWKAVHDLHILIPEDVLGLWYHFCIHTEIYAPKSIEIQKINSLFALEEPADWSYDFFH